MPRSHRELVQTRTQSNFDRRLGTLLRLEPVVFALGRRDADSTLQGMPLAARESERLPPGFKLLAVRMASIVLRRNSRLWLDFSSNDEQDSY